MTNITKIIKLAKVWKFIYNILSVDWGDKMFNFHNKKSQRIISTIIILIVILAMIVPTLTYLL